MSLEQQIRDAYKTTLGRDVDSDGSLGYWMNQGDNWQSAFQTAAAAEISARPTNYPALTGTQAQQQQQVADSAQSLYGRSADQLTAAGQGYGTGIGLHPRRDHVRRGLARGKEGSLGGSAVQAAHRLHFPPVGA